MPRPRRAPLNVFLNSHLVGQLQRHANGAVDFRYDQSWLDWEYALPVSLSLPLREERYAGAAVLAVFDNLLPDNEAIRRRMAGSVGASGIDAYSLLSASGRDCVGALAFLPEGTEPSPAGMVEGTFISDEAIGHLLGHLGTAPLGLDADTDFRISIAGAQEKTALLYQNGGWHKPLGTTATTHIFKPAIGRLPNGIDLGFSVENEFFCLKLMNALGVPSAQAEMKTFGNIRTLIVERFDRCWTTDQRLLRLPQEDLCQALSCPPSRKYETDGGPGLRAILELLRGSDEAEQDRLMFLRANIVFWLLGATDGHAKNFSIALSPGGHFRLSPLYDVLSAQPSVDQGQIQQNRMKLAMAIGNNRHYVVSSIAPRHFEQTAAAAGIAAASVRQIFDDLRDHAPLALEQVTQSLPQDFPASLATSIGQGLTMRLRAFAEA